MDRLTNWRKSTRSNDGGECVEVATSATVVGVRDSKDRTGPMLAFEPAAWTTFVASITR
nr:DUF397 domain-containing protein [Micromonospora sp. DSM 115978]